MYCVVVPFRNGHKTIERLLDDIPASIDVIVVDDVSDRAYTSERDNVTTHRLDQRGYFSGAVNKGIELAGARDVLVLNQDVFFPSGFPADIVDHMARRSGVFGDGVFGHPAWPKGYVQGTFMYMRRDALDAVGGLDAVNYPLWGATAEWQLRACRAGFAARPIFQPEWLGHVRGREPFGSSIAATLKAQPEKRTLFIRTPPRVSVIVTCYNYGRYLAEAVASLIGGKTVLGQMAGQTIQDFEIVIVDDCSTDNTQEVALSLADDWRAVRYIRRAENGGTPAANNTGINASFGKYISILCADDMMEETRLEVMLAALEGKDKTFAYDNCRIVTGGRRQKEMRLQDWDAKALLCKNHVHAGIVFPKQAWVDAGQYHESMRYGREDWQFNVALALAGWSGEHVRQALYLYRRERQNRSIHNTTPKWRERFLDQLAAIWPSVYMREGVNMCKGCGGPVRIPGTSRAAQTETVTLASMPVPGVDGMTLIQYQGDNWGSEVFYGPVTRMPYSFGKSRPNGNVDNRDVRTGDMKKPGFLEIMHKGKHLFARVEIAPAPVVEEPVEDAQVAELRAAMEAPVDDQVDEATSQAEHAPDATIVPFDWSTISRVTTAARDSLHAAGVLTFDDLLAATDEELIKLDAIGAGTVRKLREYVNAEIAFAAELAGDVSRETHSAGATAQVSP